MNTDLNPLLNMSGCETVQPAPEPEKSKETRLLEFVQAQIKKLGIRCPETVHQCDHVIIGAYEFIEGCCEIVGYMEADDESI